MTFPMYVWILSILTATFVNVNCHQCVQINRKLFCQQASKITSIPLDVNTVYIDETMGNQGLNLLLSSNKLTVKVVSSDVKLCTWICLRTTNWNHHCQCVSM